MYPRVRKRRKRFARFILTIVLIAVVFFFTKSFYGSQMLRPVDSASDTKVAFEIAQGDSIDRVAKGLKEKELIRSASVFKSYLKKNGLDREVKAGNFILSRNLTAQEIASVLTNDALTEAAITIPEGFTIDQIEAKLVSQGLIQKGELTGFNIENLTEEEKKLVPEKFLPILSEHGSNLEGLLFPDTYFINPASFSLNDFVLRLIRTMDEKITPEMHAAYTANERSLYDILTMASILEREVRTEKDLPIVAGILWKRYDSSWPLGTDATIVYVTNNSRLTTEDLEMESAYNTRKYLGLPPTPISSPGLSGIKAAIYPAATDYWFYLTTLDTGEVIYSISNEEHNVNKAKYLQ